MKIPDIYTQTTDIVIRHLEDGLPPWGRPWRNSKIASFNKLPSNLVNRKLYAGSNILLLWLSANAIGHQRLQYCTYHQANAIGARVRKGERAAAHLIITKPVKKEENEGEHTVAKLFPVFNVSQLENLPEDSLSGQVSSEKESGYQLASALVKGCTVKIKYVGNRPLYNTEMDQLCVPAYSAAMDGDDYWQRLNHQLIHAAGHTSRLDRDYVRRFGNDAEAFQELVAELGSAFLCARFGITTGFQSTHYVESWLRILNRDTRAIFTAASYAWHAVDWLWCEAFPAAR